MKRALIVQGGLALHKPKEVAEIFAGQLIEFDFHVEITDDLNCFVDEERMKRQDLVVLNYHLGDLNWKLGWVEPEQAAGLINAIRNGVGLAGIHAGLGDAFRNEVEFQYMVGGQWVAHPGDDGVDYEVDVADKDHPITKGVESSFAVKSEKYFMHMDPGVHVLATTDFGDVKMPVAWTKSYHQGKVFYCSLGHTPEIVTMPPVLKMVTQGFLWAAR